MKLVCPLKHLEMNGNEKHQLWHLSDEYGYFLSIWSFLVRTLLMMFLRIGMQFLNHQFHHVTLERKDKFILC